MTDDQRLEEICSELTRILEERDAFTRALDASSWVGKHGAYLLERLEGLSLAVAAYLLVLDKQPENLGLRVEARQSLERLLRGEPVVGEKADLNSSTTRSTRTLLEGIFEFLADRHDKGCAAGRMGGERCAVCLMQKRIGKAIRGELGAGSAD